MHLFRRFATHYSKGRNTGLWPVRPAECHSAEGFPELNSGQNVRWAHRLKVCVPSLHEDLARPPAHMLITRQINFCCLCSGLDERADSLHDIETDLGDFSRA
jgi:hypothetical protein